MNLRSPLIEHAIPIQFVKATIMAKLGTIGKLTIDEWFHRDKHRVKSVCRTPSFEFLLEGGLVQKNGLG
jgi:hypothetical protein